MRQPLQQWNVEPPQTFGCWLFGLGLGLGLGRGSYPNIHVLGTRVTRPTVYHCSYWPKNCMATILLQAHENFNSLSFYSGPKTQAYSETQGGPMSDSIVRFLYRLRGQVGLLVKFFCLYASMMCDILCILW